jgi:hypothetical protein
MPRKHEPMKRTQHYITQSQIGDLAFLSAETGYGVSEHLRRALDGYFDTPHIKAKLDARGSTQMDLFEDLAG